MDKHTRPRKARNAGLDTPMLHLLRCCTVEQREWLAQQADTNVNYLYAIAGCHRKKISVQLAFAIEQASRVLHDRTGGDTPVITAQQIATMCAVAGLDDGGV